MRRSFMIVPAALAAFIGVATSVSGSAAEHVVRSPAPLVRADAKAGLETAYFAGGCFWGVEGVFSHVKGVRSATSGYAGGTAANATYPLVSSGRTRHAETVRVVFDPRQVNYADLLRVYFSVVADPTRLNAQGPDHGPQYRSALFPANLGQERVAKAYLAQLTKARTFSGADRHPDRAGRFLPCGRISSAVHGEEPASPLHRRARPAEGRRAQAALSPILAFMTTSPARRDRHRGPAVTICR